MIEITATPAGLLLPIQAKPKASRSAVVGVHAGRLKVAVTEAPERGKANAAVLDVLAEALSLRRSQVELVAGEADPRKTVRVTGIDADELRRRIAAAVG